MDKNKGGRPKNYSDTEQLQNKIDEYFNICDKKIERVRYKISITSL
jgi:hypothetical protein